MVDLLSSGEITPTDALAALEKRIAMVEKSVNALPALCFDRAYEQAREMMKKPVEERGVLSGLPVPIKDLTAVSNVRTTRGSLLFEHFIPEQSGVITQTLETNGAIVYAKSNTPEFGTGGHTFNEVYGTTRNPHNLSKSAGGSSGGAAAALACGTAWLAHGSDMAGSLRTPASFCGVASLRPSPGLIAAESAYQPFQVLGQDGPMARSVEDLGLFADAMTGLCEQSGLAKPKCEPSFLAAARQPVQPLRIAYSHDLGVTQTDILVRDTCDHFIAGFKGTATRVDNAHPDLSDAYEAFRVQRALSYAVNFGADLASAPDILKPEVVWNIELGLSLDGATIRSAMAAQGRVFNQAAQFMQDYDVLICPAAKIPPFDAEERYPGSSSGVPIPDYYEWLAIAYAVTATTLPVITIPCGKTADGLPVGIQLIGKSHGEAALFSIARYIEQMIGWDNRPINPRHLG